MKRVILIALTLIPLLVAGQQSLSVASFELAENDLTALNEATKVIDDNGNLCALIKVETTQRGFVFDGGTVGIARVDDSQPGEIWVYVPAGLRRITIRHSELGVLRDYYFPMTLERGKTYVMQLISGRVVTSVQPAVNSQYLVINYTPKEAMVEIDNEIVEGEDGVVMKRLQFGKHTFRISMADYHPETGQVTINDPNNKVVRTIALQPAYGWIKVLENTTNRDATVYIDNKMSGHVPFQSERLSSGQHDMRVVKSKYLTHREQVFVNDGKVTEVTPSLTANFETVTFRLDGNAEVWVNNEMVGRGNCTAELEPGEYVVETKLPSHTTQTKVINVRIGDKAPVNLPSPTPIYGRIDISSRPYNSDIYLDGKEVGKTPLFLQEVLIGQHRVQVKATGKEDLDRSVTVKEGETITIDEPLQDKRVTTTQPTYTSTQPSYSSQPTYKATTPSYNNRSSKSNYRTRTTPSLNEAENFVSWAFNYSYYKPSELNQIPMLHGFNTGMVVQNRLYRNLVLWWGFEYQFAMTDKNKETWMNHNFKIPFRLGFAVPFGSRSSMTIFGGPSLDLNLSTSLTTKENGYTVKVDFISGNYQYGSNTGKDKSLKMLKVFDIPLGVGIMYKFGKFGIRVQYEWGMLDRMNGNYNFKLKADQLTAGIILSF